DHHGEVFCDLGLIRQGVEKSVQQRGDAQHDQRACVGENAAKLVQNTLKDRLHTRPHASGFLATRPSKSAERLHKIAVATPSHWRDGIEAAAGYPATPCWVTTAEKCVSGRASAQILATVGMAITGKVMPAKAKAGPVIKLAKLVASRRFAVSAISS